LGQQACPLICCLLLGFLLLLLPPPLLLLLLLLLCVLHPAHCQELCSSLQVTQPRQHPAQHQLPGHCICKLPFKVFIRLLAQAQCS
jgi:hypothetical protein